MVNITDYANFGVIYYVQNYRTIEMMWLATVTKRHKLPQSHSFAVQQSIAILFLATQHIPGGWGGIPSHDAYASAAGQP